MTRGRERRCVLAGLLAGLLVAALRRVCGALPPRWWRSDHDGGAGVSVRTRPDPRAGRGVAVALRRAAVRVQLGPGAGDGGDEPAEGREVLRHRGRSAHAGVAAVALQPAEIVEPDEERHRAVVGGELERGVLVRPGEPGDRAGQLARVEDREAAWPDSAV